MELVLFRFGFSLESTLGLLSNEIGEAIGFVIEDQDRHLEVGGVKVPGETCIPRGRYQLGLRNSPKHGTDTIYLVDVKYFKYIDIHAGNTDDDTEGCLCGGRQAVYAPDFRVLESRLWLEGFRNKYVPLLKKGTNIFLTVR